LLSFRTEVRLGFFEILFLIDLDDIGWALILIQSSYVLLFFFRGLLLSFLLQLPSDELMEILNNFFRFFTLEVKFGKFIVFKLLQLWSQRVIDNAFIAIVSQIL
jgi:hypothetical protein